MKATPKAKLDLSRAWVTWTTVGHGIQVYALFVPAFPCPLGLVWGIGWGGSGNNRYGMFEVFGSFTAYFARRSGVRKRIDDELLKTYRSILTGATGPAGSGKKFMQATGYEHDRRLDVWIKVRKPNGKKS